MNECIPGKALVRSKFFAALALALVGRICVRARACRENLRSCSRSRSKGFECRLISRSFSNFKELSIYLNATIFRHQTSPKRYFSIILPKSFSRPKFWRKRVQIFVSKCDSILSAKMSTNMRSRTLNLGALALALSTHQ